MNKEDYKNFDNFIKKYIQHCVNIPGIAVVIFNSDKILHKYIYGYSYPKDFLLELYLTF